MVNEEFPNFRKLRLLAIGAKLWDADYVERAVSRTLSAEDDGIYKAKLAVDFVEKHEEFKPMIKEIIGVD